MADEALRAFQEALQAAERFNEPFLKETVLQIGDLLRTAPGEIARPIHAQLLSWSERADNPRLQQALRELGSS
jgi:hypothetical protein